MVIASYHTLITCPGRALAADCDCFLTWLLALRIVWIAYISSLGMDQICLRYLAVQIPSTHAERIPISHFDAPFPHYNRVPTKQAKADAKSTHSRNARYTHYYPFTSSPFFLSFALVAFTRPIHASPPPIWPRHPHHAFRARTRHPVHTTPNPSTGKTCPSPNPPPHSPHRKQASCHSPPSAWT